MANMRPKKTDNTLYAQLIGIFIIVLLMIVSYGTSDKELTLGNFTLNKIQITPEKASIDTLAIEQTDTTHPATTDTLRNDTTSQRILFFGDSMVEGLSKRLRQYADRNGHELLNVIWYSSSTMIWAQRDTLAYYIRQFQPTYILICLGGNELSVRDLDKRNQYIHTIIQKLNGKPYVWIGPPNWKEDTGINRLIEQNAGTKRYFPSKRLKFQRGEDGAHPTMASAAQWMDTVALWMSADCQHPIRLESPEKNQPRKGKTVMLAPLK